MTFAGQSLLGLRYEGWVQVEHGVSRRELGFSVGKGAPGLVGAGQVSESKLRLPSPVHATAYFDPAEFSF